MDTVNYWPRLTQKAWRVSIVLGSFSNDDGDGNENDKNAIGLIGKNNNFACASHFCLDSLPSLRDYDEKMPNFTCYGGS